MRVYVVHPGTPFSTADVYAGICGGLRANGVEVIEGRLDQALQFQAALYDAGQVQGVVTPGKLNLTLYTSPYIVQHAIATQPDQVIVVSAHNFNIASAKTLRLAGLRTAVVMTESPYFATFEQEMAAAYDVVFTNERRCATGRYFDHKNVHYLPHAYNPAVHNTDVAPGAPSDVLFIGSMFPERAALFGAINWGGLKFTLRGYMPGQIEQDIVENSEAAALYRAAKVNINHHRTTMDFGSGQYIAAGAADSLNPRAYELAACGAFQLMDDSRAEAHEVFRDSLATYKAGDSASLERELRWWLAHDAEREEWAAAQNECVRPHTWQARAKQMLEVLA
jgi:spore maturation protein CgeB